MERLTKLIQSSNCYCFSTWTSIILSGITWKVSSMSLGVMIKVVGAQAVFFSILPVQGEGIEKECPYPAGQELVVELVSEKGAWFL